MSKRTGDKVARYVIVREDSNRIVAKKAGTHDLLDRLCDRLHERHPGRTFFYDDASAAGRYLPQDGPGMALEVAW